MKSFSFSDRIILRTPMLPYEAICYTPAYLRDFFTIPSNRQALFLSSPDLHDQFVKWNTDTLPDEKKQSRLILSLTKYAIRMRCRATPFGLFSGCSSAVWAEKNNITRSTSYHTETRLDMHYLVSLGLELSKKECVRRCLSFFPNSSLHDTGHEYRYVEYYYIRSARHHRLSSVKKTPLLQSLIDRASQGLSYQELIGILLEARVPEARAISYIHELIDLRILSSSIEPSVTGPDYLYRLRQVIDLASATGDEEMTQIKHHLDNIAHHLTNIDAGTGFDISLFHEIMREVEGLGVPFDKNKLFQSNTFFPSTEDSSLSRDDRQLLLKVMDILSRLSRPAGRSNLSIFRDKFVKRYEDREIPLLDALDSENGIGYADHTNESGDVNPLLDGLNFPEGSADKALKWSPVDRLLLHKLMAAAHVGQFSIGIRDEDVVEFQPDKTYCDTLSVLFSVVGHADGKNQLQFKYASGVSAANFLGRFAIGNTAIREATEEIAAHEKALNPDALMAEIVHLPEDRTGNILTRPVLRDYEIPYLATSAKDHNHQLSVQDLYLSVQGNKIVLRSKTHNREVLPRMANAHNFSYNALPVYHFLCELQEQGRRSDLFLDWGSLKSEFRFIPRVTIHNVIVSPATWNIDQALLKDLPGEQETALADRFKTWSSNIPFFPERFFLADGDNELLIDTNDELSLRVFINEVKHKKRVVLKECPYSADFLVKNEKQQGYLNEFIAILKKDLPALPAPSVHLIPYSNEGKRSVFSPGSEWLYYKIYCGIKTADKLLTEIISPLIGYFESRQLITTWFFIRYGDPEPHIRLRFRVSDPGHTGHIISTFHSAVNQAIEHDLIWKLQIAQYEPELERYGPSNMALTEELFHHDSACTLEALKLLRHTKANEQQRWLFALSAIHKLLDAFEFSLEGRTNLMEGLMKAFFKEQAVDKALELQLADKYRRLRKQVDTILFEGGTPDWKAYDDLLHERGLQANAISKKIDGLLDNKILQLNYFDLIGSYIHMTVNRIFRSNHRMTETVLYYFLFKAYKSKLAMSLKVEAKALPLHEEKASQNE